MANSFPTPPLYNGQYAPQQYYHPYNGTSQTPATAAAPPPFPPPGGQHNPAFAAVGANTKRFEANSHVPSPPLPFQFPPNFNPDLLKHIAASTPGQHLPFPPPPPPPHMFTTSFATPPHTAVAPTTSLHPPFPPFPQHRPPYQSSTPTPTANQTPAVNGQAKFQIGNTYSETSGQQLHQQSHQQPQARSPVSNLDGAVLSRASEYDNTSHEERDHLSNKWPPSADVQHPDVQNSPEEQIRKTHAEKKEQAQIAITNFVAAGITYQNIIDEKIKAPVLDRLYTELGYSRNVLSDAAANAADKPTASKDDIQQPSAREPHTTSVSQPEVLDPGMERKDRIARLLAAKKGQTIVSAKSSQSASPAPVETPSKPVNEQATTKALPLPASAQVLPILDTVQPPASKPQPEVVSQPDSAGMALKRFNALPTPVREEMKQSGFSIPGLFMTSAEQAEQDDVLPGLPSASVPPAESTQELNISKSRKRSAEPFSFGDMPHAKRQVSQVFVAPSQEIIVEAPTPMDTTPTSPLMKVESREAPGSSDSDKAVDNSATPTRSKVNQNKLKDRMAALKAEVMRKNARKKALQDGMPVLDAEVEKTRERLEEHQSRLSVVRKDIETKQSEIVQAREEESLLVHEIQRLENQLADGESGQQQFSTELTQLNDQIVADEQASQSSHQVVAQDSPAVSVPEVQAIVPAVQDETSKTLPSTEQEDEKLTTETPSDTSLQAVAVSVDSPSFERPHSDTDYNPDQEDLDRQLNSEAASTVAHAQDSLNNTDQHTIDEVNVVREDNTTQLLQDTTTATATEESDDDRMSIDEESDNESDGSVSMSDSGSEDYEPTADTQDVRVEPMDEIDDYEPQDTTPYQQSTEAENDDYEPAERVDVLNVDSLDTIRQETEPEPSKAGIVNTGEIDNSAFSSPRGPVLTSSAFPTRPGSTDGALISNPTTDQGLTQAQEEAAVVSLSPGDDQASVPRFVPYQSPLASMKSFRFHPQFNEHVKSGYRSLTYSNRIDSENPVCETELQGMLCTDVKCDLQHFGSMGLPDDKILVQMSSASEFDKEKRDDYLLGLKKVIASLREQGVKEFSAVANALSQYRRDWMAQQDGIVT